MGGFGAGFVHPLGGFDHVLAMVAVGLLAARLGGRALWTVPPTFVGVMVLGGFAGMTGIAVPFVELGIIGSVIVLGLAVALDWRVPVALAAALVAVFAVFHGHAHGTEMPSNAAGGLYGLGFAAATALLHGAGIGLGHGLKRFARPLSLVGPRLSGSAIAAAGLLLIAV